MFYEYAQKLLAFTDAQTREIRQRIQSAADTLHIGIPPTSGSIYYHTLISQFQATYPDIVLQITEVPSRRILSLLDEGQLDLGVVLEPISREAYVTRPGGAVGDRGGGLPGSPAGRLRNDQPVPAAG